jgi:hypothetical protein
MASRTGIDGVSQFFDLRWDAADMVRMPVRPELINAGGLLSGAATYADGRLLATAIGSYTIFPRRKVQPEEG